LYCDCAGSPDAQSIQARTVLKPSALICWMSLRQASYFARASRSSIGARALPPLYQTATGKKCTVSDQVGSGRIGSDRVGRV
jgi:hypothetical protein